MLKRLSGLEEFILPLQVTLQWTFVHCAPSINTGRSQAWVWGVHKAVPETGPDCLRHNLYS